MAAIASKIASKIARKLTQVPGSGAVVPPPQNPSRWLELNPANDGLSFIQSRSSISGNVVLSFTMRIIAQDNPSPQPWHAPRIYVCSAADYSTYYFFELKLDEFSLHNATGEIANSAGVSGITVGQDYQIEISRVGTGLVAKRDGTVILSATNAALTSGICLICSLDANIRFSNIVLNGQTETFGTGSPGLQDLFSTYDFWELEELASGTATLGPLAGSPVLDAATLVADMTQPHQALVHGINPDWSWGTSPRVGVGVNFPADYAAPCVVTWGIIGTAASGNNAPNTRVQIRRLVLDVKRAGVWSRIAYKTQGSDITGALYTDYETNTTVPADIRAHGAEGISVKMPTGGGSFHFFTASRFNVAAGAQEIVCRLETRLILDDTGLPDDRAASRILACAGGDVWRSQTAQWSATAHNNDDVAIGRFKFITNDWQEFSTHTLANTTEANDYIAFVNTQGGV